MKAAQMSDVVEIREVKSIRRKNDGIRALASRSFIVTHPGAVVRAPIDYLDSAKLHPYLVDYRRDCVYFLETADEIDHDKVSFSYEKIQENVVRLVSVPIAAFLAYLPEAQASTGRDLVFLHHPGRCGSTLLHKLLGSHPQIAAFSEHLILNNVTDPANLDLSAKVLKAVVKFLQSRAVCKDAAVTVFKLAQKGKEAFETYSRVFPDARHLYLTRDAVKVALSYVDLSNKIYGDTLKFKLGLHALETRTYSESTLMSLEYISENETVKRMGAGRAVKCNPLEFLVFNTLIKDRYFEKRGHLPSVCLMHYDDLIDITRFVAKLSPFFRIDMALVDQNLYGRHSQQDSIADLAGNKRVAIPEKTVASLRAFADDMAVMPL